MEHWRISERLAKAIRKRIENYVRQASPDFAYYPSIMWALDTEIARSGSEPVRIPAGYALGIIRQDEIQHFIAIADESFGYVAFQPRKEDSDSSRRLIDDGGDAIIVR